MILSLYLVAAAPVGAGPPWAGDSPGSGGPPPWAGQGPPPWAGQGPPPWAQGHGPPTEEEVESVVNEIVTSAASEGQHVNANAVESYATRLATTLRSLSPEKLDRIFNGG